MLLFSTSRIISRRMRKTINEFTPINTTQSTHNVKLFCFYVFVHFEIFQKLRAIIIFEIVNKVNKQARATSWQSLGQSLELSQLLGHATKSKQNKPGKKTNKKARKISFSLNLKVIFGKCCFSKMSKKSTKLTCQFYALLKQSRHMLISCKVKRTLFSNVKNVSWFRPLLLILRTYQKLLPISSK